ncbi:lysostaphin resistance A-like protein [Nonomuraea sp. KM90]|uniref:lysostaphin resistance A-like protein n=1 Tax=Nonomuraea sp. KM90 TaxID=3457428 RepID=UPI003FCD0800
MTTQTLHRPAVPWLTVAAFLTITFGAIWAAGAALWFGGGDVQGDAATPILMLAMYTPTLGVLITASVTGELRRPRDLLRETGVLPSRSLPRMAGYTAAGLLLAPLLTLAALGVSSSAGHFAFHDPLPLEGLAGMLAPQLLIFPLGMVLTFGEEFGWSYLLPKLLPLGLWRALLTSGVIWGVFHAPFTLQGYHYPGLPGGLAVLAFTIASVLLGALLGWLRLAAGSIWPAVVAHAAANLIASALPALLGKPLSAADAALHASLSGWPGWLVMAGTIAVLIVTGQFRKLAIQAAGVMPEPVQAAHRVRSADSSSTDDCAATHDTFGTRPPYRPAQAARMGGVASDHRRS